MPYFVCKLRPPRPDFIATMTAEEAALMGEHGAHLAGLGAKAVVYGPVLDPAGPYGLAVVEVADEAELAAVTEADPVVRSGRGFAYETYPMLQARRGGA